MPRLDQLGFCGQAGGYDARGEIVSTELMTDGEWIEEDIILLLCALHKL